MPGPDPQPQQELLLTTKLYIPPVRFTIVPRPRLIERLNAGMQRKLTLVSAPAGFGKTTLLSAWSAAAIPQSWRVAWLSLDAGDNDPTRFWTYVIAALETVYAGIGANVQAQFHSTPAPPIEPLLIPLMNRLAAMPGDLVLVLDDYHLVETPSIHQALTFLLDHQPPQLHLLIACRIDPPLPVARLRAQGHLMENFAIPAYRQAIVGGTLISGVRAETRIQYIAADDIGAFVAIAFEHPQEFVDKALEIAGDEMTMAQTTEVFSKVMGRPVRYMEMPLAQMRSFDANLAALCEWLIREGYQADMPALRAAYPDATTLETWLRKTGWEQAPQ